MTNQSEMLRLYLPTRALDGTNKRMEEAIGEEITKEDAFWERTGPVATWIFYWRDCYKLSFPPLASSFLFLVCHQHSSRIIQQSMTFLIGGIRLQVLV